MKIKIDEIKEKKKYLDEVCGIRMHLNKIIKNPNRKILLFTTEIIIRMILIILVGVGITLILKDLNIKVAYVFMGISILAEIILLINFIKTHQLLNKMAKEKGDSLLIIEKEKVSLKNNHTAITIDFPIDEIDFLLITKYTITIIRKDQSKIPVFIPIDYKEDIMKAIDKYQLKIKVIEK